MSWDFRVNVPGELIKVQGDWAHSAYLVYLDMSIDQSGYLYVICSDILAFYFKPLSKVKTFVLPPSHPSEITSGWVFLQLSYFL